MQNEQVDIDESKLSFNPRFTSEIVNAVSDNIIYDLNIGAINTIATEGSATNITSTKYDFELLLNESGHYPNKFVEGARFQVKITSNTFQQPAKWYVAQQFWTVADAPTGNIGWFSIGGLGNPIKWLPGIMGFKAMPINRAKLSCTVNMGNLDHPYTIDEGLLDFHLRSIPYDKLASQMKGLSPFRVDECKYYTDYGSAFPYIEDVRNALNTPSIVNHVKIFGESLTITASRWKNILGSHGAGNYVKPKTSTFAKSTGALLGSKNWYGFTVPTTTVGGNTIYFSGSGEQLIETHEFDWMYEPILHPFFCWFQNRPILISQVNKIKISNQVQANSQNIIACSLPKSGVSLSFQTSSVTAALAAGNTTVYTTDNTSSMTVDVKAIERKIYYFEVELQKEILPAPTIKIPFIDEQSFSKQFTLSSAWDTNDNIKLVSDVQNIGRFPKRMAIWVESFDKDDATLHLTQGQGYAEVRNINLKLGGDSSVAQSFNKQQLFDMTKKNDLHQYDYQNITGYDEFISQSVEDALQSTNTKGNGLPITVAGALNFLNQSGNVPSSAEWIPLQYRYKRGIGSRILLDFSTDIPSRDAFLVPGVTISGGMNFQLTVNCEKEPGNTGKYAKLNYTFFYDDELDIINNKAQTKQALFTTADVMKAYSILKSRGNFRVKAKYLTGGGLFSSLSKAVKTYLPKATQFIEKATQVHNEHFKPVAQKAHQILSNMDNEHAKNGASLLKALNYA